MVPNLSYEHVHLMSFSKMRVAQVSDNSNVYNIKVILNNACIIGSQRVSIESSSIGGWRCGQRDILFAGIFDKFFDALIVSNFSNGTRQRKQLSHPYRTGDDEDERLKVHMFLLYVTLLTF